MAKLYPFRYFDPLRRRWVTARWKASIEALCERDEPFQITGPGWTPPNIDNHPCAPPEGSR